MATLTALRSSDWWKASKEGLKKLQKPLAGQGNVSNFTGRRKGGWVATAKKGSVKKAVDGVGKVTKLTVTN